MIDNLVRELKYGLRSLLRDKGFAATVVLTLSVCIAVNAVTFAIVHSVLLQPLTVPDAKSIVLISNRYPKAGAAADNTQSAAADYYDRRKEVPALAEHALFNFSDRTVDLNGVPEQLKGMAVTPSLFPLLQVAPALGRVFTADEGEEGAQYKVILSHALFQQLYNGDRNAIGRELRLNGRPYIVVGVMPRDFSFVDPKVRLWVPAAFNAEEKNAHHSNNWYNIGRLKPGAAIAQVQSQVDALNNANLDRFPNFKQILINIGFYSKAEPLEQMLIQDVKGSLYLLWGGAIFVLLIGVVNIANLALARLSTRRKEIATRLALGAGRLQLMRQLVIENLIMGVAGGGGGLLLGAAVLRSLTALGLARFPRAEEVGIDGTVALAVLVIVVVSALLVGLLPLSEILKTDLNQAIRQDSRGSAGNTRARRVRQVLVAAQVGFAFVLLVGSGLLLTSFRNILAVDPGFSSRNVLTAAVSPPYVRYPKNADRRALIARSVAAIRQLPGVTAAGATSAIPLEGNVSNSVILAESHVMKPGESLISPNQNRVTPGYFEAMQIKLVRGRYFDDRDNETAPLAVIVDERLARRFWPNRDPIGERMFRPESPNEADISHPGPKTKWITVVGVVRSIRQESLADTGNPAGAYYFPYAQEPYGRLTFVVKSTVNPDALARSVRAEIARIDPGLALFDVRGMVERAELSMGSRRTAMTLALSFGGLALFLSGLGIYGVLAYLVTLRRREIGIRVALGSTGAAIVNLVLREGLAVVGAGLVVGAAGAIGLQKIVEREIYGVRPLDPLVLGSVILLMTLVALSACLAPARRAAQVDPVIVLSES